MNCFKTPSRSRRPEGFVLVVVLIVVAMLSLAAYGYSTSMLVENQGARVHGRQTQARWLATSGVSMIQSLLLQSKAVRNDNGGVYDNPEMMQGVLVVDGDDDSRRGRFCVLAPRIEGGQYAGLRYGLEDESARLNLNVLLLADQTGENAGRTLLMALPGMTEDVADAILDWIDEDDEPREFGAEGEYYTSLSPAYSPANGPLTTVEELLLVRGVTPALLFGADSNRNGTIDPHEEGSALLADVDGTGGSMERGWSAYLTLYSAERNAQPDGVPRIDLNGDDMQKLYDEVAAVLGDEMATFIVALRQNGPSKQPEEEEEGGEGEEGEDGGEESGDMDDAAVQGVVGTLDMNKQGRHKLTQVLDLVGATVEVTFSGDEDPTRIASPISDDLLGYSVLPEILDYFTVNPAEVIPGRVNVNQAPRAVLMGIPGVTEEIVEQILASRDEESADLMPERRYETWLLAEGIVTLDEMKALVPFLSGGGDVYRAQVVGYFDRLGPSARLEAVVDASGPIPRMVLLRDLSHLGRGYPLEILGVESR